MVCVSVQPTHILRTLETWSQVRLTCHVTHTVGRVMLSKKLQDFARSIERARWKAGNDPERLRGVAYVAHAIADDHCTSQERFHFLHMCGVPFQL